MLLLSFSSFACEQAEYLENKKTQALMQDYGINNVRGGNLTQVYDYVFKFGRYFAKDDWYLLVYIAAALLLLALFYIDKYVVVVIPGGIR